MPVRDVVAAFFEAWNRQDGAGAARLVDESATYEDPLTPGPVPASALVELVNARHQALDGLRFAVSTTVCEPGAAIAEWTLSATSTGSLFAGVEATGRVAALRGTTVFTSGEAGRIRLIRSYFDVKSLAEQLGLMALIQPVTLGPATFGYAMRVVSGNSSPPGVIALTWIGARDNVEQDRIRSHSRRIIREFLTEPGFIGIVTGFTGDRGFTVTAWEDEDALRRALSGQHEVAMRELRSEDFVPGVWTSVWGPRRINRIWTRCPVCASLEDVSDDHRSCLRCGSTLPDRPPFW